MQISPYMKKTWNILSTIAVAVVVAFAVLLVGVRLFSIQVFAVVSGSMEPAYPVGSLIYVKKAEPSQVQVGDVITFILSDNTTATHRVIRIDTDKQCFYTRGDANYDQEHYQQTGEKVFTEDPPVHFNNLIGKPIFMIPKLGYLAHSIQHPPGTYIAISAGMVLLLLVFLPDLLRKNEKPA